MAKKSEPNEQAQTETPEVSRATRIEALKLRASELKWDPEHLREFLVDLVGML